MKILSKLASQLNTPAQSQPNLRIERGLTYLPLLTPATEHRRLSSNPSFSDAEFELFHELFEIGYDGGVECYKLWLEMYHPDEEEGVSLNSSVIHSPVHVS